MASAGPGEAEESANLAFGGPIQDMNAPRTPRPPRPPLPTPRADRSPLQRQLDLLELDQIDGLLESPPAGGPPPGDPAHAPRVRFGAIMALNQSALTRAIGLQDLVEAERLIREASDPDTLNAGRGAEIPLNLLLLGRDKEYLDGAGHSRHLGLARLLLERGADVNLRIHLPYYETDAESPLEFLLAFYIRGRLAWEQGQVDTDLLLTIGLNGETSLRLDEIMAQTQSLLLECIDRFRGDPNLQTTTSGQTIFHMALAAPVVDLALLERMIAMRALINLTDFHGTTPLMDLVGGSAPPQRLTEIFQFIQSLGLTFALDVQNCSGESALWRAMFKGHLPVSKLLLDEGAASFTMARSSPAPSYQLGYRQGPSKPDIPQVPALLAPLLGDSPQSGSSRKLASHLVSGARGVGKTSPAFNALAFNRVVQKSISPLVDLGWFCTSEVEKPVKQLLRTNTAFSHLAKDKVFQGLAIIPLMFGGLSGGLAQQCLRFILNWVLFSQKDGVRLRHFLNSLVAEPKFVTPLGQSPFTGQASHGSKPRRCYRSRKGSSSSTTHLAGTTHQDDSACVLPSGSSSNSDPPYRVALEMVSRMTLSEPEMESVVPEERSSRVRHNSSSHPRRSGPRGSQPWQYDENWHLQERPRILDGTELEISVGAEEAEPNTSRVLLHDHSTEAVEAVVKVIDETDCLLSAIEADVRDFDLESNLRELDVATEILTVKQTQHLSEGLELGLSAFSETSEDGPYHSTTVSETSTSSSEHTWDGVFSLRHACYSDHTYQNVPTSPFSPPTHSDMIGFFTSGNAPALSQSLGLPPSLRPLLELELARLQLGLSLYQHQSIGCDRGCEGNDSDSDSHSSWSTESHSGPSMTSTDDFESSLDGTGSNFSHLDDFIPEIPQQPRTFSTTSSSASSASSDGPEATDAQLVAAALGDAQDDSDQLPLEEDWFSFRNGAGELASSQRYIREHVIRECAPRFEASTDSETSGDTT
eukprot:maker-scaffold367_size194084-snap-gene-0.47 protein:Tk00506 transcript:maker-scaffold367_size194084-snap-gene-0.47-mRNA-1 annotation:"hypothetical protein L798_04728"